MNNLPDSLLIVYALVHAYFHILFIDPYNPKYGDMTDWGDNDPYRRL